jgi:hypothetical protein
MTQATLAECLLLYQQLPLHYNWQQLCSKQQYIWQQLCSKQAWLSLTAVVLIWCLQAPAGGLQEGSSGADYTAFLQNMQRPCRPHMLTGAASYWWCLVMWQCRAHSPNVKLAFNQASYMLAHDEHAAQELLQHSTATACTKWTCNRNALLCTCMCTAGPHLQHCVKNSKLRAVGLHIFQQHAL